MSVEGGETVAHRLIVIVGLSHCGGSAPSPKCTTNHLPYLLLSLLVLLIAGKSGLLLI